MKLAEALQIRSDLQRRIEELRQRLSHNATYQEGEKPLEDPKLLLRELSVSIAELESLIARINLTNAKTKREGEQLTELLARREVRKLELSVLRDFLYDASQVTSRARASEIKVKAAMPIALLQKDIDKKAAELRKLDLLIQETNWLTELL